MTSDPVDGSPSRTLVSILSARTLFIDIFLGGLIGLVVGLTTNSNLLGCIAGLGFAALLFLPVLYYLGVVRRRIRSKTTVSADFQPTRKYRNQGYRWQVRAIHFQRLQLIGFPFGVLLVSDSTIRFKHWHFQGGIGMPVFNWEASIASVKTIDVVIPNYIISNGYSMMRICREDKEDQFFRFT
jgi:hypothetical protein